MKKITVALTTIILCFLFSSTVFADPLATLDTAEGIVGINGFTTTKDDGKDIIVILLEYTNLSDQSSAPWGNYNVTAFQDGIELEHAYMYNYSFEDYSSSDTKVRPGSTLKYYTLYELSGSSPVDVEVAPMFNFDRVHAEYTFDLSGGEIDNSSDVTVETSDEILDEQTDWEAKYNKLLKKYKRLKKKYKNLKNSVETAS